MVLEEIESLSKTTKLLLLDSLLQEVCIESGLLVSHNLLYSGLKKAHSKKEIIQLSDPPKDLDAHSALMLGPLAQIQSGCRLCIYASPMGIWEMSFYIIKKQYFICLDKNY